ncbi:MAG: tRNA lysidine(34) synthetase TilS [Prolixibacteraceae bacterium]
MGLFHHFLEFVKENHLFTSTQKILLAVSGGTDSMVLLHLFEQSEFSYGVAHCNFKLRGSESDEDEMMVRQQVEMHGVPAFFESFETEEYARINGISIEMAARELRYIFFEKVRSENNYDFIATAHHQDDLIETFFLNLTRKTGIKGLTGIKEKSGKIIRPLLFAGRREIEKHAAENYIDFREDATNNDIAFQRNYIRHKILPLFSELNPSFRRNMLDSISNLREAEKVYDAFISNENRTVVEQTEQGLVFDISALKKTTFPLLILLETLKDYGFNPAVTEEIYHGLDAGSGKQFYSRTHRLVKDREKLFVLPLTDKKERIYYIEKNDIELFEPLDLTVEKIDRQDYQLDKKPNIAGLDLDKLEFPLLIRKWRQGDYFQPLGMTGFKKLSDFFIDQKVPVHEKENIWLLCSGQNIVWVMGHRIDNRFRITTETKHILRIELNP